MSAQTGFGFDISVADVNDRNIQVLALDAFNPSWSPDSRRIAFTRNFQGLYVMDADGGNKRYLSGELIPLDPSSRSTMYEMSGRRKQTPSARHVFAAASGNVLSPVWSPDERHMAISVEIDSSRDIYLLDANSNVIQRFEQFEALDSFN